MLALHTTLQYNGIIFPDSQYASRSGVERSQTEAGRSPRTISEVTAAAKPTF